VSRSWYYKWASGRLPPQAERRERLAAEVARLFVLHEGKYGSPRITADLREEGWRVSENTVAALMREQHLAARRKKKRKSTTRPGRAGGGRRTWSSGTSQPASSTVSGSATAPRSSPMRAGCTWYQFWTWLPAGCWGLPSASGTTRHWPTARWPWRSRPAAARCPEWCSTPTRAGIHGPVLPGCLPGAPRHPVHGPARVGAGQGLRFTLHLLARVGWELGF
jgi:hypothetical protein